MNVAVPRSQHSPTFGHAASWQTVWRFSCLISRDLRREADRPGLGAARVARRELEQVAALDRPSRDHGHAEEHESKAGLRPMGASITSRTSMGLGGVFYDAWVTKPAIPERTLTTSAPPLAATFDALVRESRAAWRDHRFGPRPGTGHRCQMRPGSDPQGRPAHIDYGKSPSAAEGATSASPPPTLPQTCGSDFPPGLWSSDASSAAVGLARWRSLWRHGEVTRRHPRDKRCLALSPELIRRCGSNPYLSGV